MAGLAAGELAIEPSEFDLVVIGTGLTESIVAAAAAKAGHSVLQLDPAGHYGGAWASLRLGELADLLQEAAGCADGPTAEGGAGGAAAAGITGAAVWQRPGAELGPGGQYSCDLAPKVLYGSGRLIELLLGSGSHHYLEFKLVQGSYLAEAAADPTAAGAARPPLRSVPSSRAEVFKDRQLSPLQKRALMRFLKAAGEALEGQGPLKDSFGEQPIAALLEQQGLDSQLQQSLLHGVLLADGCSASGGAASQPAGQGMPAAEALQRLRLFVQSAGRYGPDAGPFLTPLYGCGELPQAFCRAAAVAGAVQVLRCGLAGLAFDEHTFSCDGVELASGQTIRCRQLAAGGAALQEWLATFQPSAATTATHRCCAVLDGPPVLGEQQSMVVVLPAQEGAGGGSGTAAPAVRALALSSSTAVCPPGKHLLYLWADAGPGSSASAAAEQEPGGPAAVAALLPALATLADTSGLQHGAATASSEGSSSSSSPTSGSKPAVLWAAFYTQCSTQLLPGEAASGSGGRWPANVALCPGPDSIATFISAVDAAKRCYWQLFPPAASAAAGEEAAGQIAAAAAPPFPLDPSQRRQQAAGGEEGDGAGAAAADADSDDEAVAALQAALQQVLPGGGGGDGGDAGTAEGAVPAAGEAQA